MNIRTSNAKRRSGIDDLIDSSHLHLPRLVAADAATWAKYASHKLLAAYELVMLHSRVDCTLLNFDDFAAFRQRYGPMSLATFMADLMAGMRWPRRRALSAEERLCLNAERVERALVDGELEIFPSAEILGSRKTRPDLRSCIEVSNFHAWAARVALPVIGPWPQRRDVEGQRGGVYLWLPHETELLREMAALAWEIAREFGSAWPSNDYFAERAVSRGQSKHRALMMAIMCRRDELTDGRRKWRLPS